MYQPGPHCFTFVQCYPQTLLRAREVVKGVQEDDPSTPLLPVFAEAPTVADERREGLTPRQVEALHQPGADRHAALREARGAAPDAWRQRVQTTVGLRLDERRVPQGRVGFDHRCAGAAARARACQLPDLLGARHERCHVTTEAIAEQTRDP